MLTFCCFRAWSMAVKAPWFLNDWKKLPSKSTTSWIVPAASCVLMAVKYSPVIAST